MRSMPAPIRFLTLIVGGWIGVRAVMLVPWWQDLPVEVAIAAPARGAAPTAPMPASLPAFQPVASPTMAGLPVQRTSWRLPAAPATARPPILALAQGVIVERTAAEPAARAAPLPTYPPLQWLPARPRRAQAARLSGSAWLLVRDEGGGSFAPGGTLGGSQAGARLTYRLNDDARRPLALSARLYAPLSQPRGAEAAVGIDWRPIAALPINLLAERRQRIGREGRSDFALTVYGGAETRLLAGRVRVEAYGQAGIVGIEERDLFADGSVRAGVAVGPVEIGAGAWGGAQPGAARIDVGPRVGARFSIGRVALRAEADWRFRVAGDAAPGSGPALTLSTGF